LNARNPDVLELFDQLPGAVWLERPTADGEAMVEG
jgi:hypothetical protein